MRSGRSSLVAACSGYFFVLLDVTIVNVALARIAGDLGSRTAGVIGGGRVYPGPAGCGQLR